MALLDLVVDPERPGDLGDPDDVAIIAVFEGRHSDLYEPLLDTEEYERSVNDVEN